MFVDLLTQWFDYQLNYIAKTYAENEGTDYKFRVTYNNDFKVDAEELQMHLICGPEVKVEGDRYSRYLEFNSQIWAELNSNGAYTQEIFNKLYEMYSKKSIRLIDESEEEPIEYNVWLEFGTLVLMDGKVPSKDGFRAKFGLTGKIIYSNVSQVGRHTYIAFTSNPTDNNWYEIDTISPTETRNFNNAPKATQSGIRVIKGKPVYTGSLGTILRNDALGTKLFNVLMGLEEVEYISIKYEYQNLSHIVNKLTLDSISSRQDENTKLEVITITYTKDEA